SSDLRQVEHARVEAPIAAHRRQAAHELLLQRCVLRQHRANEHAATIGQRPAVDQGGRVPMNAKGRGGLQLPAARLHDWLPSAVVDRDADRCAPASGHRHESSLESPDVLAITASDGCVNASPRRVAASYAARSGAAPARAAILIRLERAADEPRGGPKGRRRRTLEIEGLRTWRTPDAYWSSTMTPRCARCSASTSARTDTT